jgi:hypothetical protein
MCNCPELQAKLMILFFICLDLVGFMSIKLIIFHFIISVSVFGVIDIIATVDILNSLA